MRLSFTFTLLMSVVFKDGWQMLCFDVSVLLFNQFRLPLLMLVQSCVCFKADLRFAVPQFQRPSHQILKTCSWVSLLDCVSYFLRMDLPCIMKVFQFLNYSTLLFEFSNYGRLLEM
jgi:hypothetical protein